MRSTFSFFFAKQIYKNSVNIIILSTIIKMRWCLFDCLSLCLFIYQSVVESPNIFILKLCIEITDISKSNIDLQQLFQFFRHFKLLAIRMTSLPTIFKSSCIVFRRKLDICYRVNLSLNNYTCLHYYNIISKQSWVDELF